MTERDAINEILLSLNELPLEETDIVDDIPIAITVNKELDIAKKKILSAGWFFNTMNMSLVPNTDGYIPVPKTFLSVDGGSAEPNLIVRDWKLFDKDLLTFVFETNKDVEIIDNIPFDDVPYITADYIVKLATLTAYTDIIGDATGISKRENTLKDAKIESIREDANKQDGNLLTDTHSSGLLDRASI